MDQDWFPLQIGQHSFDCFYQQGLLIGEYWMKSESGDQHLAVCKCGKGVFGTSMDDAVEKLKQSYTLMRPTEHFHLQGTMECNVILGRNESWIMGTVIVSDLLKNLPNETPTAPERSNEHQHMTEPTYEELKARVAGLEAEQKRGSSVTFKVSDKGGVSIYGLGRFPVTLYYEQWIRLLDKAEDLRKFLEENKSGLKLKHQ